MKLIFVVTGIAAFDLRFKLLSVHRNHRQE